MSSEAIVSFRPINFLPAPLVRSLPVIVISNHWICYRIANVLMARINSLLLGSCDVRLSARLSKATMRHFRPRTGHEAVEPPQGLSKLYSKSTCNRLSK
jgi:hypothetical protein